MTQLAFLAIVHLVWKNRPKRQHLSKHFDAFVSHARKLRVPYLMEPSFGPSHLNTVLGHFDEKT